MGAPSKIIAKRVKASDRLAAGREHRTTSWFVTLGS